MERNNLRDQDSL